MNIEKIEEIIRLTFGESSDFILERVSVEDFESVIHNYNFNQEETLPQYKAALRELVELTDKIKITDLTNDSFEFTCKLSKSIIRAKLLLKD